MCIGVVKLELPSFENIKCSLCINKCFCEEKTGLK